MGYGRLAAFAPEHRRVLKKRLWALVPTDRLHPHLTQKLKILDYQSYSLPKNPIKYQGLDLAQQGKDLFTMWSQAIEYEACKPAKKYRNHNGNCAIDKPVLLGQQRHKPFETGLSNGNFNFVIGNNDPAVFD